AMPFSARMRWCGAGAAVLIFGVMALCVCASGCMRGNSAGSNADSAAGNTTPVSQTAPVAADPLLEGWDRPTAVLLLSGDQMGYLEPCGCSLTQSGGLAR